MNLNVFVLLLLAFFLACNSPSPRRPIVKSSTPVLEKSVTLNKKIVAREQAHIKRFVAKDSLHDYFNSNKGFWYCYLHKNSSTPRPYKGNQVYYEQEIQSLDGTVLLSKEALGIQSYIVDKEHRMKGLQEGIKIMHLGEEMQFVFSSFVAYRSKGNLEFNIGPNQPIVCRIKLISIK
jgi:gliding motility-associated peptidyl-prolyl isomerase